MPRYRVYGSETYVRDVVYEVETENEQEAWQLVMDDEVDEMYIERSEWSGDGIHIIAIKEID